MVASVQQEGEIVRRRGCLWLSADIVEDPKVARLEDRVWRRMIELFCLAEQEFEDEIGRVGEAQAWEACGRLPRVEMVAWKLRVVDVEQLRADLDALAALDVVEERAGVWWVSHFRRWQAPQTDAERKRAQRGRERMSRNVTDNVTGSVTSHDRSDRSIEEGRIYIMICDQLKRSGLYVGEVEQMIQLYGIEGAGAWLCYAKRRARRVNQYLRRCCLRNGDPVPVAMTADEIVIELGTKGGELPATVEEVDPRWSEVLAELEGSLSRGTFDRWVRRLQLVGWDDGRLCLVAGDEYVQAWCVDRLMPAIRRAVCGVAGSDVEIEIGVLGDRR